MGKYPLMVKEVVLFEEFGCPICHRVLLILRKLESLGKIHLIDVNIDDIKSGPLYERYKSMLRVVGERKIAPIVLIDRRDWFLVRKEEGYSGFERKIINAIEKPSPIKKPDTYSEQIIVKEILGGVKPA